MASKSPRNVAIIGAGISGLSAAYYLHQAQPDWQLSVFERAATPGGKLRTLADNGFVVETGADSFLSRKPGGLALVRALDLEHKLQGRQPEHARTYVLRGGALHDLPSGLSGLVPADLSALSASTLLSESAVARAKQEPDIPADLPDSDISVADFMTQRFGAELFQTMIEPLLAGIYGGRADLLSLAATFPQLRTMVETHGSLTKGLQSAGPKNASPVPPFVSFAGGMSTLIEALMAALPVGTVQLSTAVDSVTQTATGWSINGVSYDALIVATSAPVAGVLLPHIAAELAAFPYGSSAIVSLAFNAGQVILPQGYGYVSPRIEGREAIACTWSSQKWAARAPEGQVLLRLYLGRYGTDITQKSDAELLAIAIAELKETLNITADPTRQYIHRWRNAIPQLHLGHQARVAALQNKIDALPTLALAGAYFNGVGIPDCIRSGKAAAEKITAH